VGGKTGGAIWVCLDFLAPPFASRQKVEKQALSEGLKKKNDSQSNASLRQAQGKLAQHDKAGEARAIAIMQTDNVNTAWPFGKRVAASKFTFARHLHQE
jgi:hypothetical protein